jgi:hypothetical protein
MSESSHSYSTGASGISESEAGSDAGGALHTRDECVLGDSAWEGRQTGVLRHARLGLPSVLCPGMSWGPALAAAPAAPQAPLVLLR